MSNLGDKIMGKAEVVGGKIEQAVGEVLGSDELAARGAAHVIKGTATEKVAELKEAVADVVEKVIDKATDKA